MNKEHIADKGSVLPSGGTGKPYASIRALCDELRRMPADTNLYFTQPASWQKGQFIMPTRTSSPRIGTSFVRMLNEGDAWNCLRIVDSKSADCTVGDALSWLEPALKTHSNAGVCVTQHPGVGGADMLDPAGMFDGPSPPRLRHRVTSTLFAETDFADTLDHPHDAPAEVLSLKQEDTDTIAAMFIAKKWDWSSTLFVVRGRPGPLFSGEMRKSYPGLGDDNAKEWHMWM